jgi:hypothetical protein
VFMCAYRYIYVYIYIRYVYSYIYLGTFVRGYICGSGTLTTCMYIYKYIYIYKYMYLGTFVRGRICGSGTLITPYPGSQRYLFYSSFDSALLSFMSHLFLIFIDVCTYAFLVGLYENI